MFMSRVGWWLLAVPLLVTTQVHAKEELRDQFEVYMEAGRSFAEGAAWNEAAREFQRASKLARGRQRGGVQDADSQLALIRADLALGKLGKARGQLGLAKLAVEKSHGKTSVAAARLNLLRSQLALADGKQEAAQKYAEDALSLLEKAEPASCVEVATGKSDLGYVAQLARDYPTAEDYYADARSCFASLASNRWEYLIVLNRSTVLFRLLDRPEQAEEMDHAADELVAEFAASTRDLREVGAKEALVQEKMIAELMQTIEEAIEDNHLAHLNMDRKELLERSLAAQDKYKLAPDKLNAFTRAQVKIENLAFAPVGARHDDSVRYACPSGMDAFHPLTGSFGKASHSDALNHYAYDFIMSKGSPVYAARGGVVGSVVTGFSEHCADCIDYPANKLAILHEDGSFGLYVHMENREDGILVEVGEKVHKGQLLGTVGFNGMTMAPHLHFAVVRFRREGEPVSLPVRFDDGTAGGFIPTKGQTCPNFPEYVRHVDVEVDGTLAERGSMASIPRGGSVQLSSKLVLPPDAPESTEELPVSYMAWDLQVLSVSAEGVVTATPTPFFEESAARHREKGIENMDQSSVQVYHGMPGDPDFGIGVVRFQLVDPES